MSQTSTRIRVKRREFGCEGSQIGLVCSSIRDITIITSKSMTRTVTIFFFFVQSRAYGRLKLDCTPRSIHLLVPSQPYKTAHLNLAGAL